MSIPLHLVTGFLGSGKTSFLNHFISRDKGKRKIAIIQNEFSPVNIDGRNLRQTFRHEILEINNGSVFCVCLLGSFISSLSDFVDKCQPDVLIMEASGLSDPIGVGQIFQSEKIKGKVYLEQVWCLVDTLNFDRIPALLPRLNHQLRVADIIILNKIDLAGGKIEGIVSHVKKINPYARLFPATYGKVTFAEVKKSIRFFPEEESFGRPDIESAVIRSSREIKPERLFQFLEKLRPNCIRYKGFVKLVGGKTVFVQAVFNDSSCEEVSDFPGAGELVLIGRFEKGKNLQTMFDEYVSL
ncbi:CobW family GTP-binding protein [Gaoshiqia sp. Z1-71]|uniref:CobW family GTP-binding protein n=1 Tax=Gaoshiqia hydrogeniformans TaxID=3290090 RepID=UPI003BF7DF75